jgi:hypothetical protein
MSQEDVLLNFKMLIFVMCFIVTLNLRGLILLRSDSICCFLLAYSFSLSVLFLSATKFSLTSLIIPHGKSG